MTWLSGRDGSGAVPYLVHNRLRAGIALASAVAVAAAAGLTGCGLAATPQPPSLHLPKPVQDLAAARTGNQVDLTWTAPSETTDRLKLDAPVTITICRRQNDGSCAQAGRLACPPGKPAHYSDALPSALTAGPLRTVAYQVSAPNQHGRSAGPSNTAEAVAGQVPATVEEFSATTVPQGVLLRWRPLQQPGSNISIRLQRTLLSPQTPRKPQSAKKSPAALPPVQQPVAVTLRVPSGSGAADPGEVLDTSAQFNRRYQYVAVRIAQLTAGKLKLQATSARSAPVVTETRDTFPPAVPANLAAVPLSPAMNNGHAEVDLSWSANAEPDFSHYLLLRREVGGNAAARQIAPANPDTPLVAPAYQDTTVRPGETYAYSVIAVDTSGNKSSASPEVIVSVPAS